jgi:hypothetical protein
MSGSAKLSHFGVGVLSESPPANWISTMPNVKPENISICENCGQPYLNFCVACAKQNREELVEDLMDQHGLSIERLITELSEHILNDRNFSALRTAIELRSMKPATKADITSGGKPLRIDDDTKARILTKVNQLIKSGTADKAD